MGIKIGGLDNSGSGYAVVDQSRSSGEGEILSRLGERARAAYEYNQLDVALKHQASGLKLNLSFRAFDQSVAFRYTLPKQDENLELTLDGEWTEFSFVNPVTGFSERGHEGEYFEKPINEIDNRCELPLLVRNKEAGLFHAILQADGWDYPRRFLRPTEKQDTIGVVLAHGFSSPSPISTPWFLITTAEKPGDLIEHNFIRDSLVEHRLSEPEWIKPGKVIRLVDLTTKAGFEGIDFAAANGLQYVEYDAGWYGNQGDPKSDATTSRPGLDIAAVCEYGRKHGIGVILYVNKIHFELQSDELFPVYQKWGVKGLKFGFVDGRTREGIQNVHKWTQLAMLYGMVVDVHDNYRTTGIQMRLPNLLTVEGIRGNEWMPTSRHNVTLPFTRFIAGAGDYTICYLNGRVKATHAHQLAISVTHFSPLQFIYWYGRPHDYVNAMGKEWFNLVPASWDDTQVIDGEPGEYYAVARRKGDNWYVGAIASESGRTLTLPLNFLSPEVSYTATMYRDSISRELDIQRDVIVDSESVLLETLRPHGGMTIVIRPTE